MKIQSVVLAMAMTFAVVSAGCGSSGGGSSTTTGGTTSGGSGGSAGSGGASSGGSAGSSSSKGGSGGSAGSGGSSGGTSGSGGASACSNVTADVSPCGGDVLGTWTVTPSCLKVGGEVDMSNFGVGCTAAPVTAFLQVTGTWTATSDGKYSDKTTTTGTEEIALPASCLNVSGTVTTCERYGGMLQGLGYTDATCENAASGGGCKCLATVEQTGGLGLLSADPAASGAFTTSNNVITTQGGAGDSSYSYCVSGSKMTWTPKSTGRTVTGTVVFQKAGTTGTGGSASGGTSGRGGSTGSGGTSTQGGQSGSGGAPVTGGNVGSGGRTGQGGAGGTAGPDGGSDVPPGTGGTATGGTSGTGGGTGTRGDGPCDIYGAANNKCVAAYSMVRALSKTYSGPLYQVRKNSSATNTGTGGTTADVMMLPDGYADIAAQDTFCAGTTCTVSLLYDQSGNNNNIGTGKKGNYGCDTGDTACQDDYESSATKGAVTAGGHKVYSLYMNAHEGYRSPLNVKGKNMPLGTAAQGIYELADGTHSGTACCWDFGNVSTDPKVYGIMNTLFFGTAYWGRGAGSGPWFMADFEAGVWAGGSKQGDPGWGSLEGAASSPANTANPSLKVAFAFGILKTDPTKYALRMANLQTADDLTTAFEGNLPKSMNNLGGIVLGVGGDNSNHSFGTFYEGAITTGYPSAATELAVFKNVKAVGYTK